MYFPNHQMYSSNHQMLDEYGLSGSLTFFFYLALILRNDVLKFIATWIFFLATFNNNN
jgi:hypothetical protein